MGGIKNHGRHIYKLNRTKKERWHLNRTLVTQLVEHERITTTLTKTKGLRELAERVMVLAKRVLDKNDENARRELQATLTTAYARTKIIKEIAPRYKDKYNNFTRIHNMKQNRKGDNAPLAYIEYIGNDLEKYETTAKEQRIKQGQEVDKKAWNHSVLKEERDFFYQKLEEAEENLKLCSVEDQQSLAQGLITPEQLKQNQIVNQGQIDFFKSKLARVEHDLFIINKNPFDLQKFPIANFVPIEGTQQNQQQQIEQNQSQAN
ncbi:Ribosomal protein L17 [Pseudocohnilembus persalinus]|uniref:Ribosomal protein L17 n=1 Tax=Pseudocohnilembus persalinus TaxID=266149 RepID=A0A0V0QDX0_PSEPJ|nr:Ribosomal protein L17 [Pseudocohnilembus persalinus]|eukprot:KRX00410.1 Ribosomal protein L17 [Pseudocohnilembus persalinus]